MWASVIDRDPQDCSLDIVKTYPSLLLLIQVYKEIDGLEFFPHQFVNCYSKKAVTTIQVITKLFITSKLNKNNN